MHEIMLLRHGKSDWSVPLPDRDRPLAKRGKRDAQKIGEFLRTKELLPDRIVCSPAKRAVDTAEKAIKVAGLATTSLQLDPRIYEGDLETLLEVLQSWHAACDRLMVVGHNPGMDELLEALVASPLDYTDAGKLMTTANLAHLRLVEGPRPPLRATLIRHVRPGRLPDTFHFEGPEGPERRERPQYYYTQSAVIPYRRARTGLEILLIRKHDRGRWSVPKGIVEPGLSPAESAAREAREEAGAIGTPSAAALGDLTIEKWGATCTVDVHAMEVRRLLDEPGSWESDRRVRSWVPVAEAARRVASPALAAMIRGLSETIPEGAKTR